MAKLDKSRFKSLKEPYVIMSVGVPGCGKTSAMEPLAKELEAVFVSSDYLREWLLQDADNQRHNTLVWRAVHDLIHVALAEGKNVVLDAMNTSPTYRIEQNELYKRFGAKSVAAVQFTTPLSICIERNRKRSRIVPEAFITKAYNHAIKTPPSKEEGFDLIAEVDAS